MDSGVVGVVDLSNNSITKMESKHDSVSGKSLTIKHINAFIDLWLSQICSRQT